MPRPKRVLGRTYDIHLVLDEEAFRLFKEIYARGYGKEWRNYNEFIKKVLRVYRDLKEVEFY